MATDQTIPPDGAQLVAMHHVTKTFGGVAAVADVSLEIRRGEVLGLLGENGAGKTTLMNVLYGLYAPDEGEIEVHGRAGSIDSPRDAMDRGIGMVHQHFMLVPDMSVAENIALGQHPGRLRDGGLGAVRSKVGELSERYGLKVSPDRVVESLSVGEKQRVEIVKSLYRGAEVLILDEPTAVLTPAEWQYLLKVIRALTEEGKSVVLITHKLEEMTEAVDRCLVLRDGKLVGEVEKDGIDQSTLARMMVGRDVDLRRARARVVLGEVALDVVGVCVREDERSALEDIDLQVRCGEVLGIAGVDGNGQRELVEVLTGMTAPDSGSIAIGDRRADAWTPNDFSAAGGAVIPEERQRTGAAMTLTVSDNIILRQFREAPFSRHGVLDLAAARTYAGELMERFGVRARSPQNLMRQLSGGNQQKVVLARELARNPKLLICTRPTPLTLSSVRRISLSASVVRSPIGVLFEDSASERIGADAGSNCWTTGWSMSAGSSRLTCSIFDRTSAVAASMFVPNSNSAVIELTPSSEIEVIFLIPWLGLTASSIRFVTSRSTASGDAPVYVVCIETIGIDISGN